MNILVVDDDEAAWLTVSRRLERDGFTVFPAADALQAIAVLEHDPIDLVVTDLRMPHVNGAELAAYLRSDPRFRNLPVIVLSAFATDDEAEEVLRQGASMMLPKEIPLDQLVTLVHFAA